MRLYLSSYRLGAEPDALLELSGGPGRVAIVTNAWDPFPEARPRQLGREADDLARLGYSTEELDLRAYFEDRGELARRLARADLLWVVGGNTFVLARAMRRSGFAELASELVGSGALVYAGYSAGSCVVGPGLEGCHLIDDADALPEGYAVGDVAEPLGWVPWRIVPHFRSDHEESAAADCAVDYLLEHGLPFRTLRDGQAIVVVDDRSAVVGEVPEAAR